jgi:lysyl-tRNA synthetase class 2
MEPLKPTPDNIQRWAGFLKTIRHFFDSKGYYEVFTPNLVTVGAFESTIDPLQVSFRGGKGELHTSPEIEMKTVLAEARLPIYQICKCFRDDPDTPIHGREFTMLEFYEPETDYRTMIGLMKELIVAVNGGNVSFKEFSVKEIFHKRLGLNLSVLQTKELLGAEIKKLELVTLGANDSWEDMFFRLLIEKIEPNLDPVIPTILRDYPEQVSPLSKANGGIAERFEIYWKEMELCNGCTELNDEYELKRRYEAENRKREAEGRPVHPFSEALFQSTSKMQNMAGVAVGLDRLFRCLTNYPSEQLH